MKCYACRKREGREVETRFGRRLILCDECLDRVDIGPVMEEQP